MERMEFLKMMKENGADVKDFILDIVDDAIELSRGEFDDLVDYLDCYFDLRCRN